MARMYFASLSEVDISSLESFIGEATGCATLPSIKAKCRYCTCMHIKFYGTEEKCMHV